MARVYFVLGGAASGKSLFAENLALAAAEMQGINLAAASAETKRSFASATARRAESPAPAEARGVSPAAVSAMKPPVYIATADKAAALRANDAEMTAKIAAHRLRRSGWDNREEPLLLPRALAQAEAEQPPAILVDCLSLWLTNLLVADYECEAAAEDLLNYLRRRRAAASPNAARLIFVANEAGLGIIPDNALARRFCREAGQLNQKIAAAADEVYWLAAGLAQKLKG